MSISYNKLFPTLPNKLRDELISTFNEVVNNYVQSKWEPSELNAGKFCEIVYTIIKGYIDGNYPKKANKPRNMLDACRNIENISNSNIPRSIRIQIPRILIALYEIRNNRNVGHVGGDVNPNFMDATTVLYMVKWIIAELIRVYHNIDLDSATNEVNRIIERILPWIWEVDKKYRILDNNLTMREKTMLLLYNRNDRVNDTELIDWLEYSNSSVFKKNILIKAHKERLLEYNKKDNCVQISPLGIDFVEKDIIPRLNQK